MTETGLVQIIEGALLAAGKPLSLSQLAELFEEHERPDNAALKAALDEVAARCEDRGYELKEVASGFRFQVRQNLSPWVARLWQERPQKYSRALLETLALIAYRQPITRGEIEEIRGVAVSSNIIKTLHEREWIRVVGHRDVPGRPAMYATTRQFLDYFNLKNLDQLPALAEIRDLETLTAELGFDTAIAGPAPTGDGSPEASARGLTVVGGTEHRPVADSPAEADLQAGEPTDSPGEPAAAPQGQQPDAMTGAAAVPATEAPESGDETPRSDAGPDVEAARPETQA
jgi:segregation and condensation protein B